MRRLLAGLALAPLFACATIVHGTTQDIGLSSTPTNAKVTVDNQPFGQTPTVAKLSRKDNHVVKLELDGYQPFEATLTRKTSGWVWGNIVFGGLIGWAVDASDGALYQLTPEQVSGQLATVTQAGQPKPGSERAMLTRKNGIYIAVVLRPDPTWTRIGTLERVAEHR